MKISDLSMEIKNNISAVSSNNLWLRSYKQSPASKVNGFPAINKKRDYKFIRKAGIIIFLILILFLPAVVYGGDYIIGQGDTLQISVWGSKELSLPVTVRPDGKITIPALGDVVAAGKTPEELQMSLAEKLKKLVKDPIVTVIVTGINNNKVYVFGGGVTPGVFDLNRRTTLLQLLCQIGNGSGNGNNSGNFSSADLRKAYVLRKGKKIKKDFYKLFIKGDTRDDVLIKPDDIIFIPALADKNIYVVGAVKSPKFIEYREGLTVMEAILDAGGFTKFARENNTVIYRKDGKREILINVKLKELIKDGDTSQNISLKPGDYVVVKEGIF